jgi:hypothetical protein
MYHRGKKKKCSEKSSRENTFRRGETTGRQTKQEVAIKSDEIGPI